MRPFFVPLCLCVFVSLDHILGNLYPRFPGKVPCLFISSVGMADNSDAWIVGKHSVQPVRHLVCAVGDDDLAGMQRIADSCAASMVERDPACARSCIEQGAQYGPVGDG